MLLVKIIRKLLFNTKSDLVILWTRLEAELNDGLTHPIDEAFLLISLMKHL